MVIYAHSDSKKLQCRSASETMYKSTGNQLRVFIVPHQRTSRDSILMFTHCFYLLLLLLLCVRTCITVTMCVVDYFSRYKQNETGAGMTYTQVSKQAYWAETSKAKQNNNDDAKTVLEMASRHFISFHLRLLLFPFILGEKLRILPSCSVCIRPTFIHIRAPWWKHIKTLLLIP